MSPQSNKNTFFGIKVSIPGINVNQATDKQLVYKNDYSTETWYALGDKSLQIGQIGSASNPSYGMNVFNGSGDVSLTLGQISTGYGMNVFNSTGGSVLILGEYASGAYGMSVLNTSSGTTMMEAGLLPSGSYGINIYDGTTQYSESGTPQILIGLLPDGTVGIVQSISGVNVNNIFS